MERANTTAYSEIVARVEQLSRTEQISLANYLNAIIRQGKLTPDEWDALADSVTVSIPPGPAFSDRREDWYGDNER
ncbi:MAG: hypothetical protein IT323_05145 [Anaerolineae bacterium]|nr:hypothetical protein [Anaerolineae bacterium]